MPVRPEFEEAVLEVLGGLEAGDVISYGEVAAAAGYRGAARAVGNLLRITAEPVPWWRVVRADGRLAAPDRNRQGELLVQEGWAVRNGRILAGETRR